MSEKTEAFRQFAANHLVEIEDHVAPNALVTLAICWPDKPDRDIVLTNGDMAEAVKCLQRRIIKEGGNLP